MSYEEEKQDRKIEQLEAEIERLRAELAKVNQAREAEIDQAGAAERIYSEGVRAKDARIKGLEAENRRVQEFRDRVARILKQPLTDCDDLILLSLDARVRQLRAQAFRIQELEGRDETLLTCHNCGKKVDDVDPCPHLGEIRFGPGRPEGEYGIPEPSCAYFVCAECLKAESKIGPDAKPREGLYGKYRISKADGSPVDPNADYFVLRLDTDPVARRAALEYSYMTPDRNLAIGLQERIAKHNPKMTDCINLQFFGLEHPRVWQITEERKAAICAAINALKENEDPDDELVVIRAILNGTDGPAVLRAMREEAEQE